MVPEKVAGDLCRTSFHNLIGGYDAASRREWVHYEWSGGGNGGFAEADGPSAMAPFDWGDLVTVQSSEVIETRFPLLVEESRLAADTGGAGASRGGLAMQRRMRLTGAEARYSLLSDGAMVPAFGVLGGMSGLPVACWVEGRGGGAIHDFDTPGKVGGHVLHEGDRVVLRSAGGGGYGDPLQRPAERVAEDVGARLRLGAGGGAALRRGAGGRWQRGRGGDGAAQGRDPRVGACGSRRWLRKDCYRAGPVSRRRICRLNPADAARAGIGEGDLVEVDTRRAAPLRAWAEIDAAVAPGTLPIDARGLDILRAARARRSRSGCCAGPAVGRGTSKVPDSLATGSASGNAERGMRAPAQRVGTGFSPR